MSIKMEIQSAEIKIISQEINIMKKEIEVYHDVDAIQVHSHCH